MREIKFRAWVNDYEQMYDVYSLHPDGVIVSGRDDFIALDNDNVELMQFTGIRDKNGREIYEGDILRFDNRIGMAFFNSQSLRYDLMLHERIKYVMHLMKSMEQDIEVVGNIYENPELLEGRDTSEYSKDHKSRST